MEACELPPVLGFSLVLVIVQGHKALVSTLVSSKGTKPSSVIGSATSSGDRSMSGVEWVEVKVMTWHIGQGIIGG
jgi:hypothetical protein